MISSAGTSTKMLPIQDCDSQVLEHMPLVKAVAAQTYQRIERRVDFDDLVNEGIVGLLDAFRRYNPDTKVPFSRYAKHRVRGAILDSLRKGDWASRGFRARQKQIRVATEELEDTLHRAPTETELAAKLQITIERLRAMLAEAQSGECRVTGAEGTPVEDWAPANSVTQCPEDNPDGVYAKRELRSLLDSALDALPPRQRSAVVLHDYCDMEMKAIAKMWGVNESRVSQIRSAALGKLLKNLQDRGIGSMHAFAG